MSRTASTMPVAVPPLSALPPVSRLFVSFGLTVARWEDHRRSRLALQRLTPQHLRDIGLTASSATHEATKPFWRD